MSLSSLISYPLLWLRAMPNRWITVRLSFSLSPPAGFQPLFKVEPILSLPSMLVLSQILHTPSGLHLKNTIIFFSNLLVPARNEPLYPPEKR